MTRRKTKAERDRQRADADHHAWEAFRPRLETLQSMTDALQLVASAPPPDSPGRKYYSNLGFFLQAFTVPMGSSYTERALYLKFIQRLDATGKLKLGARQAIEAELQRAMKDRGPWQ